jgi:hypothetical protein
MRKVILLLAMAALVAAATPAHAAYTGSLYTTNFSSHEVFRSDYSGGVLTNQITLAQLPGADGILFNPLDETNLLVGGQNTNNIYGVSVFGGGSYTQVNSVTIPNGALLLAAPPAASGERQVITSGYEGPVPNSIAVVGLTSGAVTNHTISGMALCSGMAYHKGTLFVGSGDERGNNGFLYTVDLTTNTSTQLSVAGLHNVHQLWLDDYSGHLFSTGAKTVQEIDLDAVGGPTVLYSWDLSALIPDTGNWLDHTDGMESFDGNLFVASNDGQMIHIDLTVPRAQNQYIIHNYGAGLDDVAAGRTPVPEPSTLVLAGLGVLGLGILRKRV